MPGVIHTTPALMEIKQSETHDLTIEQLPIRTARPGFWRTLAHKITQSLTPTPHERRAPVCSASRPFEMPLDRVVREYPSLAPYAHAII
jgi:hypothetical protein